MKKIRKIGTVISMTALLALSGGCAHTSQSEEQSNIDQGSIDTDTQVVEAQDDTDIPVQAPPQDTTVFIDEKLDENLFISAELKMPENNLYEYAAQLKNFDYDKVQEALGQNAEGTLVVNDGSG